MKKIFTFLTLSVFAFAGNSQTVLQENFDAGIPGAWTVTDGGAGPESWFGTTGGYDGAGDFLDGTEFAFVDSDADGNGVAMLEILTSPVFDGTSYTNLTLEFDQYYRSLGGPDFGEVQVWDGATWQTVWSDAASDHGAWNAPDQQSIDISAHINAAMQVRFYYDDIDTWAWYWAIDNFHVYSTPCTPNTGTDVQVACGADYTWIDGNVYTTDESAATHTLTNMDGCDSVVTLNLTFGTPNTGTDVITECGANYTWIDGITYTADESAATFTLTNMTGCDSVVTLNLTLGGTPNTGTDVIFSCAADYTWIDGNVYTTDESAATHTLTNVCGSDSVVTLNLTFGTPNTGTDVISECGANYTWIDGVTYTADESAATFTLTNAAGCDSVVTLNLTFGTPNTGTDVVATCAADYTWIDGVTYVADESAATFTLTNMSGCDSVVTLNLTFGTGVPTAGTDTQVACDSYDWIDGNTYTTSNTTATHTLTNAAGCDSVVTLDLTINTLDLNVTTAGDGSLMADQAGATYQWITCVDSSAVAGATDQTFAPATDGDYAVIVTMNNCSDTSACNATTDLIENDAVVFSIFPNPNNGIFNIQSDAIGANMTVVSIDGKIVRSNMKINSSLTEMNLTDLEIGTYFVKIQFNGNESVERVVIR